MKRNYKFRAWFPEHKIMEEECGVYKNTAVLGDDKCCVNENKVMQYIGTKDKNKNELCEGDIVILYCKDDEIPVKFIIEYSIKYLGYTLRDNIDNITMPMIDFKIKNLVKIGNIYENPKLFKTF